MFAIRCHDARRYAILRRSHYAATLMLFFRAYAELPRALIRLPLLSAFADTWLRQRYATPCCQRCCLRAGCFERL